MKNHMPEQINSVEDIKRVDSDNEGYPLFMQVDLQFLEVSIVMVNDRLETRQLEGKG